MGFAVVLGLREPGTLTTLLAVPAGAALLAALVWVGLSTQLKLDRAARH